MRIPLDETMIEMAHLIGCEMGRAGEIIQGDSRDFYEFIFLKATAFEAELKPHENYMVEIERAAEPAVAEMREAGMIGRGGEVESINYPIGTGKWGERVTYNRISNRVRIKGVLGESIDTSLHPGSARRLVMAIVMALESHRKAVEIEEAYQQAKEEDVK